MSETDSHSSKNSRLCSQTMAVLTELAAAAAASIEDRTTRNDYNNKDGVDEDNNY